MPTPEPRFFLVLAAALIACEPCNTCGTQSEQPKRATPQRAPEYPVTSIQSERPAVPAVVSPTTYLVKLRFERESITLDLWQHMKDSMNAYEMEIPVTKDKYDSMRVGQEVSSEFRKHKSSAAVRAGQLFDKLQRLDAEEADEIANAPTSIKLRYDMKRQELFDSADMEVRVLCQGLREAAETIELEES